MGEAKTQDGLIGFFDILGYQSFLENNDAETAASEVLNIIDSIGTITSSGLMASLGQPDETTKRIVDGIQWLVFSDTILMSMEWDESIEKWILFSFAAIKLCRKMFDFGLPLRGAIKNGKFLITKSKSCFAGRVIVDAYRVETSLNLAGCNIDEGLVEMMKGRVKNAAWFERMVVGYVTPLRVGRLTVVAFNINLLVTPELAGRSNAVTRSCRLLRSSLAQADSPKFIRACLSSDSLVCSTTIEAYRKQASAKFDRRSNMLPITRLVFGSLFLLILVWSRVSCLAQTEVESWTNLGPEGGRVSSLLIDSTSPDTMYVGANGGIFKSTNGGAEWKLINAGILDGHDISQASALAMDPFNTQVIYAGATGRVFKSVNGGRSWSKIIGLPPIIPRRLVIDPSNNGTIYVVSDSSGVYKILNGGASFIQVNTGLTDYVIYDFQIDPSNTGNIYVATNKGVFKSANGGARWAAVDAKPPWAKTAGRARALAVDPVETGTIYAGTEAGLFKSTNSGVEWKPSDTWVFAYSFAISPSNRNVIYAAHQDGIQKTTDGGRTWKVIDMGGRSISFIKLAPSNADVLYIGTFTGLFKSVDGGASWTAINKGLKNTSINAIAIDPSNTATIYVAEGLNGIIKTVDGGASWTSINEGLVGRFVTALIIDPSDVKTILASNEFGFYKSTNGGASWSLLSKKPPNSYVKAFIRDPLGIIYAPATSGLLKSTDDGQSWSLIDIDLSDHRVEAVAIHPSENRIIYVTARAGIFKSMDAGKSWASVKTGVSSHNGYTYATALAIDPSNPLVLYAGLPEGFFKSHNGGASWTAIYKGVNYVYPYSILLNPSHPNILYASTMKGTLVSTNGGQSWSQLNAGINSPHIRMLALDPSDSSIIYATGAGGGILKRQTTKLETSPEASQPPRKPPQR